jgi:hypothetical protein
MSTEPSPLKYMGTQSQETVSMAAALALAAERARERRSRDFGRYESAVDGAGSKLADAARWALAQGKDALQSIAVQLRERATVAVARYTKEDPLRAMLIAAGAGALLMICVQDAGPLGCEDSPTKPSLERGSAASDGSPPFSPRWSRPRLDETQDADQMKKSAAAAGDTPARRIDARIEQLGDWRGATLSKVRALIKQADPDVVEEWKWSVPVWSHDGLICTGETYKNVVKLTFAKGASLDDPSRLFNSSLDGNTRRAIDLRAGEEIDEKAFKALVRAAVAFNRSTAR